MVEAALVPSGPKTRAWARQHGFSDWMVARFARYMEASGLQTAWTPRFLDGLRARPHPYLRANPLRSSPRELAKRLDARGFKLKPTQFDDKTFLVQEAPISQGATLEHLHGMSTPQDLASTSVGQALGARPKDVVADMAAAPGIKALHAAGDMRDNGALVCIEPDLKRFDAMRSNLERAGISCGVYRNHPAQETPGEGWADKVIVDAPCTGEGTLPKDKHRRRGRPEEITQLSGIQEEILDAADRVLRPGGTLVYATCTFGPEENEAQITRLLNNGYRMEHLPFESCEGAPLGHGITKWPGLELHPDVEHARRFFPGIHPTLGFFVAKLTKEAA